jgi:hypothetical protein
MVSIKLTKVFSSSHFIYLINSHLHRSSVRLLIFFFLSSITTQQLLISKTRHTHLPPTVVEQSVECSMKWTRTFVNFYSMVVRWIDVKCLLLRKWNLHLLSQHLIDLPSSLVALHHFIFIIQNWWVCRTKSFYNVHNACFFCFFLVSTRHV